MTSKKSVNGNDFEAGIVALFSAHSAIFTLTAHTIPLLQNPYYRKLLQVSHSSVNMA